MNIEIIEKGKSYAARKKKSERPEGDFYQTPYSFTKILVNTGEIDFNKTAHDYSCGNGAIGFVLKDYFRNSFDFCETDIKHDSNLDFLKNMGWIKQYQTIQNPPFSLWDNFVLKAKEMKIRKIIYLGKINFFASHKRTKLGIWNNLKSVYVFDRQANLDMPLREDGKFYPGMACYAWFIWDLKYKKDPIIKTVDCSKYVYSKRIDK